MRFLPRSPRGTILRAAVAWLAGLAVLWALLPVRPRATVARPPDGGIAAVLPPGDRLLLARPRLDQGAQTGPLRTWDLGRDRVECEFLEDGAVIHSLAVSFDGRRLTVVQAPAPDAPVLIPVPAPYRIRTFDPATGCEFHEVRVTQATGAGNAWLALAGDGRTLAYVDRQPGDSVVRWWDYVAGREVAYFPGFAPPLAA